MNYFDNTDPFFDDSIDLLEVPLIESDELTFNDYEDFIDPRDND